MNDVQIATAVRAMLSSGLTVREVAELLRAHPRAIEALLHARGPLPEPARLPLL
jgi:hypothetical protein